MVHQGDIIELVPNLFLIDPEPVFNFLQDFMSLNDMNSNTKRTCTYLIPTKLRDIVLLKDMICFS